MSSLARLSKFPGLLSTVDGDALGCLAEACCEFQQAKQLIEREGMVLRSKTGRRLHPAVRIKEKALERIRYWLAKFGCSPQDRAAIRLPVATEADENPFDEFLRVSTDANS